jgi:hypothetical protein
MHANVAEQAELCACVSHSPGSGWNRGLLHCICCCLVRLCLCTDTLHGNQLSKHSASRALPCCVCAPRLISLRPLACPQIIKDAKPALILSFDLPLGHDSCACVMSHLLGVPYVVADGHPMMSGPLSTPQVSGWGSAQQGCSTGSRKDRGGATLCSIGRAPQMQLAAHMLPCHNLCCVFDHCCACCAVPNAPTYTAGPSSCSPDLPAIPCPAAVWHQYDASRPTNTHGPSQKPGRLHNEQSPVQHIAHADLPLASDQKSRGVGPTGAVRRL